MIIVFTGHRNAVCNELKLAGLQLDYPDAKWIHGGAKTGFDKQVHDHILRNQPNIPFEVYKPDYNLYPPKVAPIMRNHKMIDLMPDFLVACWDGRKKGGTYDTIEYAKTKGIKIIYLGVAHYINIPKRIRVI